VKLADMKSAVAAGAKSRRQGCHQVPCAGLRDRGEAWLDPGFFRIGASSLLNDLLMQRERMETGRYAGLEYMTVD
jgi:hypothetical protein